MDFSGCCFFGRSKRGQTWNKKRKIFGRVEKKKITDSFIHWKIIYFTGSQSRDLRARFIENIRFVVRLKNERHRSSFGLFAFNLNDDWAKTRQVSYINVCIYSASTSRCCCSFVLLFYSKWSASVRLFIGAHRIIISIISISSSISLVMMLARPTKPNQKN